MTILSGNDTLAYPAGESFPIAALRPRLAYQERRLEQA